MKKIKNFLASALTLACLSAAGVGVARLKDISVGAEANGTTIVKRINGASARVASANDSGLRFKAEIDRTQYDVIAATSSAYDDILVGMLIVPVDYIVAAGGYTHEALFAKYGVEGIIDVFYDEKAVGTNSVYAASIVNIKDGNYTRDFVGVAYTKIGETYAYAVYDEEKQARSVFEVASKAYNDRNKEGESKYSEAQLSYMKEYMDGVADVKDEAGTVSIANNTAYYTSPFRLLNDGGNEYIVAGTQIKGVMYNGIRKTEDSFSVGAVTLTRGVPDGYFFKETKTNYKLLLPQNADENLQFAAEDFNYFFKLSTGVELTIVYENTVDTTSGKYISVGETKLAKQAGALADEGLTTSGFILETHEDDIFVNAYITQSVIYGMQELLSYLIDWEYFGADCYRYDTSVTEIAFQNFDVREVADFEYRYTNDPVRVADRTQMKRSRMEYMYDFMCGPNGQIGHNSVFYLPMSKYYDEHPKWYTQDKLNLSYVANGDKEEYKLMVEAFSESVYEIFRTSSEPLIMCTIYDSGTFDTCEAQKAIAQEYNGANAASIVLFLNDVNKKVKEWLQTPEGQQYDREYYIVFLAYQPTEKAPAYIDRNGNVSLINGLKCAPEVVVQYAPIYQDFTHSIYDSANEDYLNNLKAWNAVCENMFVWNYALYYPEYFVFFDNFDGLQDGYEACKDVGVRWIYSEQGASGTAPASSWNRLKMYLEMKLSWDSSLNEETLINDWFAANFGPVASQMKDLFLDMREHTSYLINNDTDFSEDDDYDGYFPTHYTPLKDKKYWPKAVLIDWLSQADAAIESISALKHTDEEKYNSIYKSIATERLAFYYLLVELYGAELGAETTQSYKEAFQSDNEFIGGTRAYQNGGSAVEDSLYYDWGLLERPETEGKTGAKTVKVVGGSAGVSLSDYSFALPTKNINYFLGEFLFSNGTTVVMTITDVQNPSNYYEVYMEIASYSLIMYGKHANGEKSKTVMAMIGYQENCVSGGKVSDVFSGWVVQLVYNPETDELELFNEENTSIAIKGFAGKEVYISFKAVDNIDIGIRYLGDSLDWLDFKFGEIEKPFVEKENGFSDIFGEVVLEADKDDRPY